ncbi:MAG TPA: secretin N-terminal domain-containing protein [Phycisphaerae bacterium]|nr:secretin N-terminal domain-containing protein [Phycisphaerae bacterium]
MRPFFVGLICAICALSTARAALDIAPASLELGVIDDKAVKESHLTLTNTGKRPLKVLEIQVDCPKCTSVRFSPATLEAGKSVDVPVTFKASPENDGPVRHAIVIHTDDPNRRYVKIPINGMVTTGAGFWPAELTLQALQPPGSEVELTSEIVNVSDQPLTLLYATGPVDGPILQVPHEPVLPASRLKIKAMWHLPSKAGTISGELVVFVDHPTVSKLVLPYRVVVGKEKPTTAPNVPTATKSHANTASTQPKPGTDVKTRAAPAVRPGAGFELPPQSTTQPAPPETVNLDLKESIPLKDFVEIVSTQLNLNLIYDDNALNVPVSIRLSGPIAADALLPLLKTVLQSKGLAMVPTDRPDIWRIVTSHEAQSLTEPGTAEAANAMGSPGPGQIMTEFINPRSIDLETAAGLLRGFLTPNAGQLSTVPRINAIIVTDYSSQLARLHRLMDLIDKPQATASVAVVPVAAAEPAPLADKITKLLQQIDKTEGRNQADKIFVSVADEESGIVVVGPENGIPRVRDLIKQFDTAPSLVRVDYPISEQQHAQAMDTIRQVLGKAASDVGRDGMPRVVTASQRLSVLATEGQHRRIKELLAGTIGDGADSGQIQLKAYRIENRDAGEIYATLTRLLGDNRGTNLDLDVGEKPTLRSSFNANGVNPVGSVPGETPPAPGSNSSAASSPKSVAPPSMSMGAVNITIDQGTNTLLIAANGPTHQRIEKLIKQLDQKQTQVLLEITMVSVADSKTFNAAVDAAVKGHFAGSTVAIGTNNSGIGTGNFVNGMTPNPVSGFNAAIFNPASFSVFMSALEQTNKARVLNSPQILALDNKPALLQSTQEQPYTSVNASTTVSTTSFGGFAEAGTTLELTPHIAPGDYLNLEYRLEVSTFTGSSSTAGVPPPKESNAITSVVSIPDGSTVILGGLRSSNNSRSVAKVPGLGEIPILGWIGRNQNDVNNTSAFYVFVRPTILRSSKFADLKEVTVAKREEANLKSDYPSTELRFMK